MDGFSTNHHEKRSHRTIEWGETDFKNFIDPRNNLSMVKKNILGEILLARKNNLLNFFFRGKFVSRKKNNFYRNFFTEKLFFLPTIFLSRIIFVETFHGEIIFPLEIFFGEINFFIETFFSRRK